MSARAAVFSLLTTDHDLREFGLTEDTVFSNHAIDGSPRFSYFAILKWSNTITGVGGARVRNLEVVLHRAKDIGTDFGDIDNMIERIISVLTEATHVVGDDGWSLTMCRFIGIGSDLTDSGYNTITRGVSFDTLSRKVA